MRGITIVCLFLAAPCFGGDFVVQTEVTSNIDKFPAEAITTIFAGHQVFDYMADAQEEVTVFDLDEECIWRLNSAHKVRYYLPFRTLSRLVDEATLRAVRLSPTVRFAAEPVYTGRKWDPQGQRLQLTHDLISYEAKLDTSVDPDQAARYRIFADWSARLNTIAPGLPPGARLELNREIAMRESVPVQVVCQRTISEGERIQLTSTHRFRDHLTTSETNQVARIRQWLREFPQQPWQR
jgi:hypothetical protein